MVCNNSITIYHKGINEETKLETWARFNYKSAWVFDGRNAQNSEGYSNADSIEIRLPYSRNNNLNVNNFAIGDIIIKGDIVQDINTQQDLSNYRTYNITRIKNNDFGINQHIHIGGN